VPRRGSRWAPFGPLGSGWAYREQLLGIFRLTPTHWRGETSVVPPELDLTNFLAEQAVGRIRSVIAAP
jgi:hypothetical protein